MLSVSVFALPVQYDKSYMGELKYKYNRLNSVSGKRIIIAGGSGAAFDIDSSLIEENFPDYDVVNMGMYAALGSSAILELCLSEIHEGDIIIFVPEQNTQTLSDYIGADYAWQAADGAAFLLPYFFSLSTNIPFLLAAYPRFAAEKSKMWITGSAPDPDSVYRRSAFNEYGDISDNLPANIMNNGYDESTIVSYDISVIHTEFISYLNDYYKKINNKGATLLFTYCPANRAAINADEAGSLEDVLYAYHSFLLDNLKFPVIGNPNNSVMDVEWFYDTNYHLNSSGKIVYTRQLIRDLKAYISDSSLTDISIPQKPALNGKKDTLANTISAGKYSGNTEISTITINEDINYIEDYAFDGCTSLKEIHIKNTVPSSIQIGQHLLDGTNANIYVPQEALSLYKTDYRFSLYSDRIYPDEE